MRMVSKILFGLIRHQLLSWSAQTYVSVFPFSFSFSFLFCQAFDQQQQDLVDAASKALSYRQDIIEENIRLTYALQVTSFNQAIVSSPKLLEPLLSSFACFYPQDSLVINSFFIVFFFLYIFSFCSKLQLSYNHITE